MNAHIRLVSSDIEGEHPKRPEQDGEDREDGRPDSEAVATIGLPGEGRHDEILGEAPPPLVAEAEDRAGGPIDGRRPKSRRSNLFGWGRKAKAPTPAGEEASIGASVDGKIESGAVGASIDPVAEKAAAVEPAALPSDAAESPTLDDAGEAVPQAAAPSDPKRSLVRRKGPLAAALLAGVALAAIVVVNWPYKAPAPVVEPGMLAEGQAKLMAPSAALATVPPREEPNVAGERPQVHETRHDEYREMLSFKDAAQGDKVTETAPGAKRPVTAIAAGVDGMALAAVASAAGVQPDHPQSATAAEIAPEAAKPVESNAAGASKAADVVKPSVSPSAQPPAPSQQAALSAAPAGAASPDAKATNVAAPASQAPAPSATPAAPAVAQEPSLTDATKIEARIASLETAMKDRSSDARTWIDAEKADTQTFEQIANLAAIVKRLTGQVKDLQDQLHTLSTGSDEKFADLTRRVALGEANRAVASVEAADHAPPAPSAPSPASHEGQTKSGAEVKRAYRIQAASPSLAMLAATDGSPDDRPVEVAIGTDLPGYGKVRSIEQHGEAWVVKADRGSIQ